MTLAPQVRDAAAAVDPSLRLVSVHRANEANNDVLWVMGLWLRITVVLSALIKYPELPGSERDLTLQGMAMIIGYGIVMLGVCMLACVVPTRRALNIEPTIALRLD